LRNPGAQTSLPTRTFGRVTKFVAELNAKVENNTLLRILDAVFPPLPSSLSDLDNQTASQTGTRNRGTKQPDSRDETV
jgi:hypothetical protein